MTDVYEELDTVLRNVELAVTYERNGDHMGVLRCLGTANEHLAAAATGTAQLAFNEGKTKKAMAEALGCPPSVFRGMVRT